MDYSSILDLVLDNLKKLFYPEEWLKLDLSFSKSELFAMLLVDKHGEIIMSQIADYIKVPMSTATGVIERLVKTGLLDRERSESDRRIVVIKLTETGKALVDHFKSTASSYIDAVNATLTDEERQLLGKIFIKVMDVINQRGQGRELTVSNENQLKKIEIE